MIVFGGIHEVTRELNDMCAFDLKQRRWIQFFEEMNSPVKGSWGNSARKREESPQSIRKRYSVM